MELIKDNKKIISVNDFIKLLEKYKYNELKIHVWIKGKIRDRILCGNPAIYGDMYDGSVYDITIQYDEHDEEELEEKEKEPIIDLKTIELINEDKTRLEKLIIEKQEEIIQNEKKMVKVYEILESRSELTEKEKEDFQKVKEMIKFHEAEGSDLTEDKKELESDKI